MGEKLAGAGLGQAHEVLDLNVMIEFGLVVGGKWAGFLLLDQFPNALAGRLGGPEVNDLARTERGDELNQFFVRFHVIELIEKRAVCERLFGRIIDDATSLAEPELVALWLESLIHRPDGSQFVPLE